MSIVSRYRERLRRRRTRPMRLTVSGFPPALHAAESDLFCRQAAMPGHAQLALSCARVAVVGCGGLGSWVALGLARLGVGRLVLIDPDLFDRTNAPRQLMFSKDLGQNKAEALAQNLLPHMLTRGEIDAVAEGFDEALPQLHGVDAAIIGVDNNRTRYEAARWAVAHRLPAVFVMLSQDGLRAQAFLQNPGGPCLWCVLPNLDLESAAPCAAASITSCQLAAVHAVQMCAATLMKATMPTWRETSLDGSSERVGHPYRLWGCPLCGMSGLNCT